MSHENSNRAERGRFVRQVERGLGTITYGKQEAKRSKTVCAQAARAGLGATALVARTRLVTPVETAENIPSILIQRQTFNLKLKHNHLYHSFRVG